MSLVIKLAQAGNPGTSGRDKITLKAEMESPLAIQRSPIIIPLPGGSIVGLDLGRNSSMMSIAGVVDTEITELFVKDKAGSAFTVGETITGTSAWNSATLPVRTSSPTAKIVAASPSLAAPTSLFVSDVTRFFVDGETITGGSSGGTAKVSEPFPSKRRLEQIARFWYSTGAMTLTTRSGVYTVYIAGVDFRMEAGLEDRYNFKLDFVEAQQGVVSPV